MIDWKYGFIRTIWWIPFIVGWLFLFYVRGPYLSTTGVVLLIIFFILGIFLFGKKSPYQEKNRQRTLEYFGFLFRTFLAILAILFLWGFNKNNENDPLISFIFPFFLAIADIIPAFFTKEASKY
ncbi:MAG TPA: hypothetical protein K8V00_12265 [Ligilactobacillus acidipiscis]|uniref:Uncharacterized protein n=1 Tax=Ligilactobacillus acidipiscis TaxID=89059 RepID=A0A921FBB9_9LACO|nr:hypothetical protein [Ligilactobacillus acidipiscis]